MRINATYTYNYKIGPLGDLTSITDFTPYGEIPTPPAAATRAYIAGGAYYEFDHWEPELAPATGITSYTAVYKAPAPIPRVNVYFHTNLDPDETIGSVEFTLNTNMTGSIQYSSNHYLTTGTGKSVGLNAVIASLLYKKHPAELKFVMVDPKKVELSLYNAIERHYLAKLPDSEDAIITDVNITAQNRTRGTFDVTFTGQKNMLFPLNLLVSSNPSHLVTSDGHTLAAGAN